MTDPNSLADDLAMWRSIGDQLRLAVVAAMPAWMDRSISKVMAQQQLSAPDDLRTTVDEATQRATHFVDRGLKALFACDPDEQRGTPMGVMRDAVRFPSEVLNGLGAKPLERGDMARWSVPNDLFDLAPANMAEFSPEAHELSIAWGAGKAHIHLKRRRQS